MRNNSPVTTCIVALQKYIFQALFSEILGHLFTFIFPLVQMSVCEIRLEVRSSQERSGVANVPVLAILVESAEEEGTA